MVKTNPRCNAGSTACTVVLALLFCCGPTLCAQPRGAVGVRHFAGTSFPTPPQQNAPWPHGDDALSNATATLFEQGLADPRGLEYREIEIPTGNPWNGGGEAFPTHGWVLPGAGQRRFAIAWNGLIYPVLRVGNVADVRRDLSPSANKKSVRNAFGSQESGSVAFDTPSSLQLALLARLGENEIVQRLSPVVLKEEKDPYLTIAQTFAWLAFERAVCAHERGDDYLALADARLLSTSAPLIEAEAKQRGYPQPKETWFDPQLRQRPVPYLSFLAPLPALLADSQRRTQHPTASTTNRSSVAELIADLENVDARQWGQPGGVSLASDARVQALVKRGDAAVLPLIDTIENDNRLTRSVSFGRDFFRERRLISVSEAAYAALTDYLRVDFGTDAKGEGMTRAQMVAQMRAYWQHMGASSPNERLYRTLADDGAGKDAWLTAANIVQPTDVEVHSDWVTVPNRKPGQKVVLRGESLRSKRAPSVAELMARRSDSIAAMRTGSSLDQFLFKEAGQMALFLADWDKRAAIPTLRQRLGRAWSIGQTPGDTLSFESDPVETVKTFGTIISRMTLARAQGGDLAAYDEYAAWIERHLVKGVVYGSEGLQQPLIEGASQPRIARAIDFVFNDPKSPWSDMLAPYNGFWNTDFWQTPLPRTLGFRKQALRALGNTKETGTITFAPRAQWSASGEATIKVSGLVTSFRGSKGDHDTPPPAQQRAFRVCDAYAYAYSAFQGGPHFQLFWPQSKRDAGVAACLRWLQRQP